MARLELISRQVAERWVPLCDCGGREYDKDEREDIIRYVLDGAEIQRDVDEELLTEEVYESNRVKAKVSQEKGTGQSWSGGVRY